MLVDPPLGVCMMNRQKREVIISGFLEILHKAFTRQNNEEFLLQEDEPVLSFTVSVI